MQRVGEWRSLVAHLNGVQGAAGSNPVSPTKVSLFELASKKRPADGSLSSTRATWPTVTSIRSISAWFQRRLTYASIESDEISNRRCRLHDESPTRPDDGL
jgi:hypothetical protein